MGAVRLLVRNGLRRRAGALVGLALVIALGVGTAMASFAIAWRTHHAYPDYLRRAEVGELVVNPSLVTDRMYHVVATTPGVLDAVSDSMFVVTPDHGAPRSRRDVQDLAIQFRSSKDGRYRNRDRPVVHRGRMIQGNGEAFVSLDAAEELHVDVGDRLPLAFWQATPNDEDLDPTEVVRPIGEAVARVAGIGVFADEVLPDELYPRQRVVLSPDVVAPFDCLAPHPPADDALSLEQLTAAFFPEDCGRDPTFFSLKVAGGDAGVPALTAALADRFDRENTQLPKVMRDLNLGFSIVPTVTAEERARVRRSLGPGVTALQLFGVVAGLSTLTVAGLGAVRSARRVEPEGRVWFELGLSRLQRGAAIGVPLGVAGLAGLGGALAVGWIASNIGPVASAGAVEPHPAPALPLAVAASVVALAAVVLAAEVAAASWLASRDRVTVAPVRTSRPAGLAARTGHVPLALGVRAALPRSSGAGAGAGALLAGAVTVVAAVVASVVFSSNVTGLVRTPSGCGGPFAAAVMVGYGYGGADEAAITASLRRRDVDDWGLAALPGEVTVNGESLPAVAARAGFDDFRMPLVAGRYPTDDDEIALGARSARRLGLAVGDEVRLGSDYGDRTTTVTGLVVMPSIGAYQADRLGLGMGAVFPSRLLDGMVAETERARGLPPGELGATLGSFVALDLRDGVDPHRLLRQIEGEVKTWDVNGFSGFLYDEPVRPPEIADVAAMRSAPAVLATLLAATMAVALALAMALGTRARRRELAILRALGCTGRQLRSTVRWHALTVVGFGLAVGILVGASAGSVTWRAFAEGLGVVPSVSLPAGWISLTLLGGVAVAVLAAAAPARAAARNTSAGPLRDQ